MCIRPAAIAAQACIDLAVRKDSRLLSSCLADVEYLLSSVDDWEKCMRERMAARHALELEQLRERASEMRRSRLRALQLM
jgi:hypothetical protein